MNGVLEFDAFVTSWSILAFKKLIEVVVRKGLCERICNIDLAEEI
jgi:hypothetical protein